MKDSLKIFILAVDVIITCAIVGYAVYSLTNVGAYIKASDRKISANQNELEMSDLTLLEGEKVSGSQAVSLIRKYQRTIPVLVKTKTNITKYPLASFAVSNDANSPSYIVPNDSFIVSLKKTANDVVSQINITKTGLIDYSDGESNYTVDEAKLAVISVLGDEFDSSMSWDDILGVLESRNNEDYRRQLALFLGESNADSVSWADLLTSVKEKIQSLEKKVDQMENDASANKSQFVSGTLNPKASVQLDFEPSMVSVIISNGAAVYMNGVWHGGDYCSLYEKTLQNDLNDVVVYYAFK